MLSQGFTKLCATFTQWKKIYILCCAASVFPFSLILPSGFWTYLNKTSSNSAGLFTKSVRRPKEISNSPLRNCTRYFSSFFIYYLRNGRNKTYRDSWRVQTPTNVYLAVQSELFTCSSLFEGGRECTLCPFIWQLLKQYSSFGFQSSLMLGCFAL